MSEKPIIFRAEMVRAIQAGRKTQTRLIMEPQPVIDAAVGKPPYNVGDVLWVRETFTLTQYDKPVYRADARDQSGTRWSSIQPGDPDGEVKWRSPIHMPRWASRLFLRVTAIRSERLQDITEAEANAEGVECECYADSTPISGCWWDYQRKCWSGAFPNGAEARGSFQTLWQSIHGGDSWAANPVVWVIDFEPLTKAGEQ